MRLLLPLLFTSCSVLTSPSSLPESWEATVEAEWAIATDNLESAGVPRYKLSTIQRHDFSWKEHPGTFMCGEVEANGCYSTQVGSHSTIAWNAKTPHALRHEIGHGILHKLGYSCWKQYEHKGGCP